MNSDLNWTDDEISVGKKWLKWEEMTINWENIDLTWDEVFILLEVENIIRRGGGNGGLGTTNPGQNGIAGVNFTGGAGGAGGCPGSSPNIGGNGGSSLKEYMDGNTWKQVNEKIGPEKTKSLIKVYCRVNNIDYEESRTPMEDIKVSINEFERFVKEAVSVKVNI